MFASLADNVVAHGRKQKKVGMLNYKAGKEAWELLLSSANQVALNSFNGSHAGKYFSFENILHNCQREIQVWISPNWSL